MHNYQFVNYTEKASTLEKRGMKILWERKVQECLVVILTQHKQHF